MTAATSTRLNLVLTEPINTRLREHAAARGLDMSEIIRTALCDYLDRHLFAPDETLCPACSQPMPPHGGVHVGSIHLCRMCGHEDSYRSALVLAHKRHNARLRAKLGEE